MHELILATNNNHKAGELSDIFGKDISIKTLEEINFTDKIIENGNSFTDNALIKCKTVYEKIKKPIIADDSGLCVEALRGEPGIFSARYGNKNFSDIQRYEYLLNNLKNETNMNASFVCSLVLYINPNRFFVVQEETCGQITRSPQGINGFGYDPIFFLKEKQKTMAELTEKDKNEISHRGKAARIMKAILSKITL